MQCRICLEDGNAGTLLTPCQCRGTSSYIHRACLEQYIQYYPDRICRVCHTRFFHHITPREEILFWVLLTIMGFLLGISKARLLVKLVLLGVTVMLSVYFLHRGLFTVTPFVFLAILVLLFLPGGDPTAIYLWLTCLGAVAFLCTLAHHIPARIVLTFMFTLFFSGYVGFLIILAYHTLDPPAFTVLLGLLYFGWYAWVHAPPLEQLRLRLG